jgi:hypothetical protein
VEALCLVHTVYLSHPVKLAALVTAPTTLCLLRFLVPSVATQTSTPLPQTFLRKNSELESLSTSRLAKILMSSASSVDRSRSYIK